MLYRDERTVPFRMARTLVERWKKRAENQSLPSKPSTTRPSNARPSKATPSSSSSPSQASDEVDSVHVDESGAAVGAMPEFNDPDVGLPADKDRNMRFAERLRRADRKKKIGPRQRGFAERVSLKRRNQKIAREDAGGERIHRPSTRRTADVGGVERRAYIDPHRTLDKVIPAATSGSREMTKPEEIEANLLFETANVATRLRNTNKVQGERVKTMDYFVASVETPSLEITQVDVGAIVAREQVDSVDDGKICIACLDKRIDKSGEIKVYAFRKLLHATDGCVVGVNGGTLNETLSHHAVAFMSILGQCCAFLGLDKDFLKANVRLFYAPTLRANESVCLRSKKDGYIYFNLLAFKQCGFMGEISTKGGSYRILQGRRPWNYYVMRLESTLDRRKVRVGRARGLYDIEVRRKIQAFLSRNLQINDGLDVTKGNVEKYSCGYVDLVL